MRRSTVFGCVLAVGFLAGGSDALAMIQIDRGIAGARLGATRGEVRAALGTPSRTASGTNDFGPWVRYTFSGGVRVFFQGRSNVTSVETTGLGDRTSRGVGVGSSEAAVRTRVRGVKCETIVGFRSCHTSDFLPGRRVTDFRIVGGKVDRVVVGIVVD